MTTELKNLFKIISTGFAFFGAALSSTADLPEVIYFQGFHNNSGSQQTSGNYDWFLFNGSTATNATNTFNRITTFSNTTTSANVNAATPFGDNITNGFWTYAGVNDQFTYTEFTIPSSYSGITISFQNNVNESGLDSNWHAAIRLASGDWYVSDTSASTEGWSDFSVELTDNSLWREFDFIPGSNMGIVSSSPALTWDSISAEITAIGFYGDITTSSTFRIDNYQVVAVIPEPSTYALLMSLALMFFCIFKRRHS